jgi:signal recognition particle GTPase
MLDNLTQRLAKVVKTLRGQARLTEDNIADMLREVRMALLEADVALPVVKELVSRIKEKAVGQEVLGSLTPGQALVGVVHDELTELMGGASVGLNFATQPPAIMLMAGLQGAGKTTTVGKLAKWLRRNAEEEGAGGVVRRLSSGRHRAAAYRHPAGRRGVLPVDAGPEADRHRPRRRGIRENALFRRAAGRYGRPSGHRSGR